MSLKTRAILVVVVGLVLGFSLSFSGGLIGGNTPDTDAMAAEQARLQATRDFKEGVAAMSERRTPEFEGR